MTWNQIIHKPSIAALVRRWLERTKSTDKHNVCRTNFFKHASFIVVSYRESKQLILKILGLANRLRNISSNQTYIIAGSGESWRQ